MGSGACGTEGGKHYDGSRMDLPQHLLQHIAFPLCFSCSPLQTSPRSCAPFCFDPSSPAAGARICFLPIHSGLLPRHQFRPELRSLGRIWFAWDCHLPCCPLSFPQSPLLITAQYKYARPRPFSPLLNGCAWRPCVCAHHMMEPCAGTRIRFEGTILRDLGVF